MIFVLSVTVLLLLLNGLFVAAEFAIVAAPRLAMQRRAAAGDKMAKQVIKIKDNFVLQDQYIATAQLGITLATLGLGMYSEHHIAEWLFHFFEHNSAL